MLARVNLAAVPADPFLAAARELHSLPLAQFTEARNELAKQLKPRDAELAARIKALRKPAVAAWVLNRLVHERPEEVEQVLAVGAALRQAHASLDAQALRDLARQRRQVTAALAAQARVLAVGLGQPVSPAVAEQVEATLTAAMLDAEAAEAVRGGLLVNPLSAAGVPDASGGTASDPPAAATAGRAKPTPVPTGDAAAERERQRALERARAEAERRRAEAERAVAEAGRRVAVAEQEREAAAVAVRDLEALLHAARERLAAGDEALDRARGDQQAASAALAGLRPSP